MGGKFSVAAGFSLRLPWHKGIWRKLKLAATLPSRLGFVPIIGSDFCKIFIGQDTIAYCKTGFFCHPEQSEGSQVVKIRDAARRSE
jgi:hypothetical protein